MKKSFMPRLTGSSSAALPAGAPWIFCLAVARGFHKQFGGKALNKNNTMKNMNNKYMRQRFISGLLVTLSVTSLALLRLQVWVSAAVSSKGAMDLPAMNSRFGGWAHYWWPDVVMACLFLTLTLTALAALFSLRLSKGQKTPGGFSDGTAAAVHRPATALCGNSIGAGLN